MLGVEAPAEHQAGPNFLQPQQPSRQWRQREHQHPPSQPAIGNRKLKGDTQAGPHMKDALRRDTEHHAVQREAQPAGATTAGAPNPPDDSTWQPRRPLAELEAEFRQFHSASTSHIAGWRLQVEAPSRPDMFEPEFTQACIIWDMWEHADSLEQHRALQESQAASHDSSDEDSSSSTSDVVADLESPHLSTCSRYPTLSGNFLTDE